MFLHCLILADTDLMILLLRLENGNWDQKIQWKNRNQYRPVWLLLLLGILTMIQFLDLTMLLFLYFWNLSSWTCTLMFFALGVTYLKVRDPKEAIALSLDGAKTV